MGTCGTCGGAGSSEGNLCETCYGSGAVPITGALARLMKVSYDLVSKCDATLEKCDSTLTKCDSVISQCTNLQTDVTSVGSSTGDIDGRVDEIEETMAAEIDVHVWFYDSITQGTFSTIVGTNHWRGRQMYNNPGVAGDRINYKVLMKAGTYDFRLVCTKGPSYGTTRMYIDDVEKAAINTYASGVTHNTINCTTGIVIAETGVKTVSLKVDGDFQMNVAAIMFHKVG